MTWQDWVFYASLGAFVAIVAGCCWDVERINRRVVALEATVARLTAAEQYGSHARKELR
jgi:hypothetical protein